MDELQDKVILITGASRGIGKAISEVCAQRGAIVVVSSIEKEHTDFIARNLPGGLDRHSSVYLDVTNPQDRKQTYELILKKYKKLDGLVNNAGIDFNKPLFETTSTDWNNVMKVNLDPVFELSQLAIKQFLTQQGGGAIVNITSVHIRATYKGEGVYAAAKAALTSFSKSLACEFAKNNIQINCVAPGLVRTEIWKNHVKKAGSEELALKEWKKNIPSGRIVEPEEIGETVSFLLSERAKSINGTTIFVDGGMTSQLIASK